MWVLIVATLAWLTASWFLTLSSVATERARAGAAADLAALAGAERTAGGAAVACLAVARVATANQAELVRCYLDPESRTVTVVVSVQGSGLLVHLPPAFGRARAGPSGEP